MCFDIHAMQQPGNPHSLVEHLLEIVLSKNHKKKVAEMNIHPQILEAVAISLQVFIAALRYIFYRFIHAETEKKSLRWIYESRQVGGFFVAQSLIGLVVIGEFGKETFTLDSQ